MCQMTEIEQMKRETHPMQAKKDLAQRIVADFHSADAATKAGEDWAKQFQKDEVPDSLEVVEIRLADVVPQSGGGAVRVIGEIEQPEGAGRIRIDKLIRLAGLATSNTEAAGKQKQGAVSLVSIAGANIDTKQDLVVRVPLNQDMVLRVGRRMKRIRIMSDGSRRQ